MSARRSRCALIPVEALGAAGVASIVACAQISSTSELSTVPGQGEARVVGASGGWELDRSYEARWLQLGNQLIVELHEHRSCQQILHVPVVRVEKITRRADATLAWEFLVAGALAGFAIFAFSRPEAFGGHYVDGSTGEVITNTRPGYRTGGIFLGISGLMLAAGFYDIARARDEAVYTDAFELHPGPEVDCAEPVRAVAEHEVTLVVGDHEFSGTTDAAGRVRLFLPSESRFADRKGRIADRTINAAVKVDPTRAVRVDFAVPYDRRLAPTHTGHAEPEPRTEDPATDRAPGTLPPGTPPAAARERGRARDREATQDASADRSR